MRTTEYSIRQQRRRLGFEPYVAPTGFDKSAQSVDIHKVFSQYYRNHRNARWIYKVFDNAPYSDTEDPVGQYSIHFYTYNGVKHSVQTQTGILDQELVPDVNYTQIKVQDATKFLDPAVTGNPSETVIFGGPISVHYYNWKFTYTSIDYENNLLLGGSMTGGRRYFSPGFPINQRFNWKSGSTKRYVIVHNNLGENQNACCSTLGAEWLYCGKDVTTIQTSGSGATICSIKWIHVNKLDNITNYHYCCHYGHSALTGNLYLSRGVVGFTNPFSDPEPYSYRGNIAFTSCTGLTGSLVVPAEFVNVRPSMFYGCSFSSLTIEEGILNIGVGAFYGCNLIENGLVVPNSTVRIGEAAFWYATKIPSLDLGSGIVQIDKWAFRGCSGMIGSLIFPTSLTTIGEETFLFCTGFSGALTITSGITSIREGAFGDCNFNDIDVTANSGYEDVDDTLYQISGRTALHSIKSVTGTISLQSNTLNIGNYCFHNNLRTGALSIPNSVTDIGQYAFNNCTGLTSLTIGSSVVTIDYAAFNACTSILGTITIPNSVISIGTYGFASCQKFITLILNSGLVTIGGGAFINCYELVGNLVIPDTVTTIGSSAFQQCTKLTGTLTIGAGVTSIGSYAFYLTPLTGTLSIPSAVTSIGEAAFLNNNFSDISSSASGFTISDYVLYDEKTAGQIKAHTSARAYSGTLTLRSDTTYICAGAFYNNTNRSGALNIPYTVTYIGEPGFANSTGFTSVTIGDATNKSNIETIGAWTFYGCSGITVWNIYRLTAPSVNTGVTFGAYAKPLHLCSSGTSGYDVAPWTQTEIFSSITYDL